MALEIIEKLRQLLGLRTALPTAGHPGGDPALSDRRRQMHRMQRRFGRSAMRQHLPDRRSNIKELGEA